MIHPPYVYSFSLSQGLTNAASVLMSGAERLKKSQQEIGSRQQTEFHFELHNLRQNWRLKKVGNSIIGDLSYRSGMCSS